MPDIYSLPYNPLRVTSFFGFRNIDIPGATKWHPGLDLGTDRTIYKSNNDGGNILAVANGVVCNSYFNVARGWVVIIDHGNGFKSLYQHLKQQGLGKGVKIMAGQPIGRMGNTGVGAQLHLHIEFILNLIQVDPLPYLLNIKSKEVEKMENIYKTINEVPKWYKPSVEKMITLRGITPGADNTINISEDMCRIYTSFEKVGLLGALLSMKGDN